MTRGKAKAKTKTRTRRPKRPPRAVWLVVDAEGVCQFTTRTAREAASFLRQFGCADERVVGPYLLAERVRER